jgi:hypothetical protein
MESLLWTGLPSRPRNTSSFAKSLGGQQVMWGRPQYHRLSYYMSADLNTLSHMNLDVIGRPSSAFSMQPPWPATNNCEPTWPSDGNLKLTFRLQVRRRRLPRRVSEI